MTSEEKTPDFYKNAKNTITTCVCVCVRERLSALESFCLQSDKHSILSVDNRNNQHLSCCLHRFILIYAGVFRCNLIFSDLLTFSPPKDRRNGARDCFLFISSAAAAPAHNYSLVFFLHLFHSFLSLSPSLHLIAP